eukprot:gnl/TRDRNA2_/TRDRNA2_80299_c0_seq2.p1 gnl/TRDRNA2_/TRDRNA2_80299_c0~~gnl/TRDRNA2_/TRDRNA2_80299_c0_seq2.p1  ORF type:complete len:457 (+),score=95.76 gnl/TRDRNA2_/TRDRNA2_80299_c0_seq2:67-1437(+)
MRRHDSLPHIPDGSRGAGMADLKEADPMNRRIEKERMERYARDLREQMGDDARRRQAAAADSDDWYPPTPQRFSATPPGGGGRMHSGYELSPRMSTPPLKSHGGGAATNSSFGADGRSTHEKVAHLQDIMREKVRGLEQDMQKQWASMNGLLQEQLAAARDATEAAMMRRFEELIGIQAEELRRAREDARAASQAAAELNSQLRSEMQRLQMAMEQAQRCDLERLEDRLSRAEGLLGEHTDELRRLWAEIQRVNGVTLQVQRDVAALNAEKDELWKHVKQVPILIKQLRDEVPRLVRQLVAEWKPKDPPPPPPPPPVEKPSPWDFPTAYGLLRNGDDEFLLMEDVCTIVGRNPTCGVCIAGSQCVSNQHASVSFGAGGSAMLKDLGSRNGTLQNEKRLQSHGSSSLYSGDILQFGVDGPSFMFEFGPKSGALGGICAASPDHIAPSGRDRSSHGRK